MMKHTRLKVSPQEKTGCHTLNQKKVAVKKYMNNTDITPPPVISTVGAEWRNLTPKCGKPMVAGDLSTLRFIRAQNLCPIPARSSARDDDTGGQLTVIYRKGSH